MQGEEPDSQRCCHTPGWPGGSTRGTGRRDGHPGREASGVPPPLSALPAVSPGPSASLACHTPSPSTMPAPPAGNTQDSALSSSLQEEGQVIGPGGAWVLGIDLIPPHLRLQGNPSGHHWAFDVVFLLSGELCPRQLTPVPQGLRVQITPS